MAPERPTTRSSVQTRPAASTQAGRVTRAALEKTSLVNKPPKSVVFATDISPIKRRFCSERSASETSDEGVGDLSSASPAALLPDIPPSLARPRHPLARAWTLWHCQHDGQGRWAANQRPVATVATVEEFWQVQQLLLPPSCLGLGSDLAVFRAGLTPDWEDKGNLGGGRLVVRRERGELDESWLALLFCLIGEHAGAADQVNGVVASVRSKGDRVAVWLADSRRLAAVVDVSRMVRDRLNMGPKTSIKFSVHKEEIEKEGGGARLPPILL